jgi:hypothetical protein
MIILPLLLSLQGPVLISELWPGEGIPHFVAKASSLTLYSDPSRASTSRQRTVRVGAVLAFDDTRFVTVRPGHVVARNAGSTSVKVLGKITYLSKTLYYRSGASTQIRYAEHDTLEYLQNRAEGTCIIRVRGEVAEADECPAFDRATFALLDEPQTEWWIHATFSTDDQGWLLVDPKAVREIGRTF